MKFGQLGKIWQFLRFGLSDVKFFQMSHVFNNTQVSDGVLPNNEYFHLQ